MTTNYPTSLDIYVNPAITDLVGVEIGGRTHDEFHADNNDAIEALQAKVGANSSTVQTSHDFKLSEISTGDKAVAKTASQTLTNKSLQDSTTTIVDNTDATKAFKFEASGITTGTTRTFTVPDANTTLVGTDTVQTITNKRIPAIFDTNGNEMIEMTATASAVNNLEVVNAATGGDVEVKAKGDDTNVNLKVKGKGTGSVKLGNAELKFPNADSTAGYSLTTNGSGQLQFQDVNATTLAIETGSFVLVNSGTTVITHSLGRNPRKITFFTGFSKTGSGSSSIYQFNSHGVTTYNGTTITNIAQAIVGDQSGSFRNAVNATSNCIYVDAADISPTTSRFGTAAVTGVTSTNVTVTNSFTGTLAITVNYIIE